MKKRMVITMAALLLLVAIVFPIAEARAEMRNASGTCGLSNTGRSVKFRGKTSSIATEDTISVTATLQEKRGSTWHDISSKSKTEYNSDLAYASKTVTVDGNHYYRVVATHYAQTGSVISTSTSETSPVWIP